MATLNIEKKDSLAQSRSFVHIDQNKTDGSNLFEKFEILFKYENTFIKLIQLKI